MSGGKEATEGKKPVTGLRGRHRSTRGQSVLIRRGHLGANTPLLQGPGFLDRGILVRTQRFSFRSDHLSYEDHLVPLH